MNDCIVVHWSDRTHAYRSGQLASMAAGEPSLEVWIDEILGGEKPPETMEELRSLYDVRGDGLAVRRIPAAQDPPDEMPGGGYCVVSWHDRDVSYADGRMVGTGTAGLNEVERLEVSLGRKIPRLYVQEFLNERAAPGTLAAFLAEYRVAEDGITAVRTATLPPAEMEYRRTRLETRLEIEARENQERYGSPEQRDPCVPDILLVTAESPRYGELQATVERADYEAWARRLGLDIEGVSVSLVTVGGGQVTAVKPGLSGGEALRAWQERMLRDGFSIADHERTYDAIPPFFRKAAYGLVVPGGEEQESLKAFWLNWLDAPFEYVEDGWYLVPEEPATRFAAAEGPHGYGDTVQCEWCDGVGFRFRHRSLSSMYGGGTGFEKCMMCGGAGHVPNGHTGDSGLDEELATFGNHMGEGIWFGAFEAGDQGDFDLVAYRFHAAGPQGGPMPPEGHHPDSLALAEMLERELGPREWLAGESRSELLQELDEWFGGRDEMLREHPEVYCRGRGA